MAGPSLATEDKPTPRLPYAPSIAGTPTRRIVVDGSQAAGARAVAGVGAGASGFKAESSVCRMWCDADTYSLTIGGQPNKSTTDYFEILVVVDPLDDDNWSTICATSFEGLIVIPPNEERTIDTSGVASAVLAAGELGFYVYVIGVPAINTSLASVKGWINVRAN